MNKFFTSIKTVCQDPEFQKVVIVGIVNTATLVVVGAALHAVTNGVQNAVSVAMDKMNQKESITIEVPPVVEVTTVYFKKEGVPTKDSFFILKGEKWLREKITQ
jgi:hypothetical protein